MRGKTVERRLGQHLAAALPRRHLRQQLGFAVQRADAGRAIQLVAGEGVEIDVEPLYVGRAVNHALSAVDHHACAGGMRQRDSRRQIRAAAGDVGHLPQRQQAGFVVEQGGQLRQIRQPIGADRQFHHPRAGLLCHHQPGDQVGVVFRFAHQDFIARLQARTQVALRHQVDRLGGAARPDDVVGRRCIDQLRHLAARSFETGGQILRRPMLAAVHGGGVIAIKLLRGVDHRLRFQRGGGAVQIDAVLRERGKLLAKKAGVKGVIP